MGEDAIRSFDELGERLTKDFYKVLASTAKLVCSTRNRLLSSFVAKEIISFQEVEEIREESNKDIIKYLKGELSFPLKVEKDESGRYKWVEEYFTDKEFKGFLDELFS